MRIRHARVHLEVHERKSGGGPALLLLHELYGSASDWGEQMDAWPGAVYALDFTGHGASDRLLGGAYVPELLLGDADAALAAVGPAVLAGKGFGAYIALLLAGARRDEVGAALLWSGRGLAGGGPQPDFEAPRFENYLVSGGAGRDGADPRLRVLESDVRPPDYAQRFAGAAQCLLLAEDGAARPPWWEEVRRSPNALRIDADPAVAVAALIRATRGETG